MFVLLLIAFLLVLALGILYGVFLRGVPQNSTAWRGVAQTSFGLGILAIVLTALAAILSFTSWLAATPLNGPLAVAAFLAIPVALVGLGCGAIGWKSGARSRAIVGLALSAVSLIAWTIMEMIVG